MKIEPNPYQPCDYDYDSQRGQRRDSVSTTSIIASWILPVVFSPLGLVLGIGYATAGRSVMVYICLAMIFLPIIYTFWIGWRSFRVAGWKGLVKTGVWIPVAIGVNIFVF